MKKEKIYLVADFETTGEKQYIQEGRTRVYLFYVEGLFDDTINKLGVSIEEFYRYINSFENKKVIIYFHNLSFDILFLEYFLQENNLSYEVIRDEYGSVYRLKIGNLEFRDSLKILCSSVDDLPNERNIEKLKEFDYEKIRTEEKIEDFDPYDLKYVKHDVWKVKDCLKEIFDVVGDSLTIGSVAFKWWKNNFQGNDKFKYINTFPKITDELDCELRKFYSGGLVILNPEIKGKIINEPVISFDVNSLFPYVMLSQKMPCGHPTRILNEERYEDLKKTHDLFLYCVEVKEMKIKNGYHPFISKDKMFSKTKKTDFTRIIKDQVFFWSCIDFEEVKKYYDIEYNIIYDLSFAFKSIEGIYDDYIQFWGKKKKEAKNEYERLLAKRMLNSLYGKNGSKRERFSKISCFDDVSKTIYFEDEMNELEYGENYYLPLAIFITSGARKIEIEGIQQETKSFLYGDTDSIHLIKRLYTGSIEVDEKEIGKWKFEGESQKTLFLNNKQYIKNVNGKIKRIICSLNKKSHSLVDFNNMKIGSIIENGKNMKKHVKGGFIIVKTDFTFK